MKYNEFNRRVFDKIPENARVLDIGCDTGLLGREVKNRKNPKLLVGVEYNKAAADLAGKWYDKILIGDVERIDFKKLKKNFFDCVVLADVLEHLNDPKTLLLKLKPLLRRDGVLVISVPNVVFILNRMHVLLGVFDYTSKGIMDSSHRRFFTINSIRKLVLSTGFDVFSLEGYINTRKSLKFLNIFAKIVPPLFAYQILIVARR